MYKQIQTITGQITKYLLEIFYCKDVLHITLKSKNTKKFKFLVANLPRLSN